MAELLLKAEVYAVVGAALAVYNELGSGFLEPVYQEAMEIELRERAVPFERQRPLHIRYKGRTLEKFYIADFLCFGQIIVEIKAIREVGQGDKKQLINYLKATGLRVGILINFGDPGRLDWERVVLSGD